jgi:hypothetical protein
MQPRNTGPASTPELPRGDVETLDEALEVLRTVASVRACDRALAVRYSGMRSALLAGRLRSFAPPYLVQCVSVFKFHDFINLYAHDAARRVEFIDQTFEGCRRAVGFTRRYDVFGDDSD